MGNGYDNTDINQGNRWTRAEVMAFRLRNRVSLAFAVGSNRAVSFMTYRLAASIVASAKENYYF